MGSQTSCHPLINHLDLMIKLLAVLVPVPIWDFPFYSIFWIVWRAFALLLCSVNAKKLSLASKKHLATTMVLPTILGVKMTLSRGILAS